MEVTTNGARRTALALGGVLVALAVVAPVVEGVQPWLAVRALPAAVFVAAAAVVWTQGSATRTGWLLFWCGAALAVINVGLWPVPAAAVLRQLTGGYAPFGAFLLHLLVTYPGGATRNRAERTVVVCTYVVTALYSVTQFAVGDDGGARFCGRFSCADLPPVLLRSSPVFHVVPRVLTAFYALLIVAAFAAILRRRHALPAEQRYVLRPVLVTTAIGVGLGLFEVVWRSAGVTGGTGSAVFACLASVLVAVAPATLVLSGVRARLVVFGLSELVASRPPDALDGGVSRMLAHVLGDPTARLLLVTSHGLTDESGAPAPLPVDGVGWRTTPVGSPPLALIVSSDVTPADSRLLHAASDTLGLLLGNARLQQELRQQVDEARTSRRRIVTAADAERRRIERDLHDGAQQYLVSSAVGVRLARDAVRADPERAEQLLAASETTLREALAEIRRLAQGIYPAVLTDRGVGAAVEDVAHRLPLAVEVADGWTRRLPPEVETAAYLVVCESLANVVKHAGVERARVRLAVDGDRYLAEVSDAGRGALDPSLGSGLTGLGDRLAAVGASLELQSDPTSGSRVLAVFTVDHPA